MACVAGICCSLTYCEYGTNQCSCAGGVSGTCATNCENGQAACLPPGVAPTNTTCPDHQGPAGSSYQCADDGICCPAAQVCDDDCCSSTEACYTDCASGVQRCLARDPTPSSTWCPTSATGDLPAAACVSDGTCCTTGAVCAGGVQSNGDTLCCAAGSTCAMDCADDASAVCVAPDDVANGRFSGGDTDLCVAPNSCMAAAGTGGLVCCDEEEQCGEQCCVEGAVCTHHSGSGTCIDCSAQDSCASCANQGCAWCVIDDVCVKDGSQCGTPGGKGPDTCAVTAPPFTTYDDEQLDDDFDDDDDAANSNECVLQAVSCCANMTTACDCTALSMCSWCTVEGAAAPSLLAGAASANAGGKCVPVGGCASSVCPLNTQFHQVMCPPGVGVPWLLVSVAVGAPLLLWLSCLAVRGQCVRTAHGPGSRGRCTAVSAMATRPLAGALQAWLAGYSVRKVRGQVRGGGRMLYPRRADYLSHGHPQPR